jgi:hypothetical protein
MLSTENPRDLAGIARLVVASLLEADGEGLDGSFGRAAHIGDDTAAVDATGKKRSERDVTHHLGFDRPRELFSKLLDPIFLAPSALDFGRHVPITTDLDLSSLFDGHVMGGRELPNPAEDRMGRDDELVGEKCVEAFQIELTRYVVPREKSLDLRGKDDVSLSFVIVKGLLPRPVSSRQETLTRAVPKREGKLPVEVSRDFVSPYLVAVHHDFHIRAGGEPVATPDELFSELAVVVDLTVADESQTSIFAEKGLASSGDIDDGESLETKCRSDKSYRSRIIRTAMMEAIDHEVDLFLSGTVGRVPRNDTNYATHVRLTLQIKL